MPYLVINVLLQVVGIYLCVSTPSSEAWGIPPRAILGLLLLAISCVTGLVFSFLVCLSPKRSRAAKVLLTLGMLALPIYAVVWTLIHELGAPN